MAPGTVLIWLAILALWYRFLLSPRKAPLSTDTLALTHQNPLFLTTVGGAALSDS